MSIIRIVNLQNKEIEYVDASKSVLHHIHDYGVDWMFACGAKGRCTTCRMIVEQGMELLSPPSERELFYRERNRLKENERLCCQTYLSGEGVVEARIPHSSKFPHMQYDD